MGSFSIWHWLIVLVIVLLVFGRGKIPELMGDMAKGIKSFKKGMAEEDEPARRIASEQPLDARPIPPPAPAEAVPPAATHVPPVATPDPDRRA